MVTGFVLLALLVIYKTPEGLNVVGANLYSRLIGARR